MSTLSIQAAARDAADAAKAKKKTKSKRDENGRFIKKDEADLAPPSM